MTMNLLILSAMKDVLINRPGTSKLYKLDFEKSYFRKLNEKTTCSDNSFGRTGIIFPGDWSRPSEEEYWVE